MTSSGVRFRTIGLAYGIGEEIGWTEVAGENRSDDGFGGAESVGSGDGADGKMAWIWASADASSSGARMTERIAPSGPTKNCVGNPYSR